MKKERQDLILELIAAEEITTQEMLRQRLAERGFDVTQATLSRDIRELKLGKERRNGHRASYAPPVPREQETSLWTNAALRTDYAGNMAVIHCQIGTAQAVAAALDADPPADVVGTIAGDDTIFVLLRTEARAREFARTFAKSMETGGYLC